MGTSAFGALARRARSLAAWQRRQTTFFLPTSDEPHAQTRSISVLLRLGDDAFDFSGKAAKRVGRDRDPDRFAIGRAGNPAKLSRNGQKSLVAAYLLYRNGVLHSILLRQ